LDKQFDRAEEAFENCQRTSNMPRQINYFKPKTFIKKALDFSIVELSVKPILESPINLNSIQPQPSFNKQFDLLLNLSENQFNGYKNYLFCSNEAQANVFMIFLKV
jgi:transcription-repair coupling factor (superfamily II helicase)